MTIHSKADAAEGLLNRTRQYSTFYIEEQFFGIEVLKVQEVLRYLEMTPVPMAPEVIKGLINLRGQIVTAVDMRCRLGLEARGNGELPMNIIVRSEDGPVSLLVDEIGDVLEVPADSYEHAPDNMPREQREMIECVYKLDGRLLLVLNAESVLQAALSS